MHAHTVGGWATLTRARRKLLSVGNVSRALFSDSNAPYASTARQTHAHTQVSTSLSPPTAKTVGDGPGTVGDSSCL
jgi:hypothetical protein